jgi:hypothetical protein
MLSTEKTLDKIDSIRAEAIKAETAASIAASAEPKEARTLATRARWAADEAERLRNVLRREPTEAALGALADDYVTRARSAAIRADEAASNGAGR